MARLARLALSEEEIEPMARELSAVLDHVAKMGELSLDDVAPTSHVVEMTGALRADRPRPSLPREVVLDQAPDAGDEGFLVPSPQALTLAVRRRECSTSRRPPRSRRSRRGELSAQELFEFYRERAQQHGGAAEDGGLNCLTWVAEEAPTPPAPVRARSAGGRAAGGQGPVLHQGRAEPVGLAHPRGL